MGDPVALHDIVPGALDAFFSALGRAGRGVLVLDYDGTLAPFNVDRYRALPSPGVEERLRAIHADARTRLVFNTGRPAREIHRMLDFSRELEIWGCHGREHVLPGRPTESHGVTSADEAMLAEAETIAHRVAHGGNVETKTGCVAIHWRPLPDETRARIREDASAAWAPLMASGRLHAEVFNGGIELSVAGRSKGDAMRSVLASNVEALPITFLGDDLSDENGFREMKGQGLPVLVEARRDDTAAEAWASLGPGVVAFLDRWMEALRSV